MSKPYGMTIDLRIIRPTTTEDKVWDAVECAIDAGWMPEQFISEVRSSWSEYLARKRTNDDRVFAKAEGK